MSDRGAIQASMMPACGALSNLKTMFEYKHGFSVWKGPVASVASAALAPLSQEGSLGLHHVIRVGAVHAALHCGFHLTQKTRIGQPLAAASTSRKKRGSASRSLVARDSKRAGITMFALHHRRGLGSRAQTAARARSVLGTPGAVR